MKLARTISLAGVQSGIWTLFEVENGKFKLDPPSAALVDKTKRKPIEDYLKVQGRFDQMTSSDVDELKRWIDENWDKYKNLQATV